MYSPRNYDLSHSSARVLLNPDAAAGGRPCGVTSDRCHESSER